MQTPDNKLQHISELHRSYNTLRHLLLFCDGEDGYSIGIPQRDHKTKSPIQKTVSAADFYSYRIWWDQPTTFCTADHFSLSTYSMSTVIKTWKIKLVQKQSNITGEQTVTYILEML